jgi:hypothetical protein
MPPTSDDQIQFMVNIQRLLDEGLFTASYKIRDAARPGRLLTGHATAHSGMRARVFPSRQTSEHAGYYYQRY